MEKQEKELEKQKEKTKNKEIFEDDTENQEIEPEVEEIPEQQKRIIAENEKNKGNEALRAKDFNEAIQYYNKSLQFDPTYAITYCNRALAYLKLKKNYDQAISDCNNALKYDPGYLKAYFRRGKAFMEQKRYSKAIEDFQYIMEKEPQNSEVNAELKEARSQLSKQSEQESKDKFKRVQIVEEEDSDEEEQEEEKKTEDNINETQQQNVNQNQQIKEDQTEKKQEEKESTLIQEISNTKQNELSKEQEISLNINQNPSENKAISTEFISNVQQNVINELLNSDELPQTATLFEKNISAFKNNIELLFQYLIKTQSQIQSFYNKKGMPYEVFNKIIQALNLNGMSINENEVINICLLYTSPSPRDRQKSRMPSSA
eukprot:TRINITY_DN3199_c0_g1_i1.p1 TRINITY_DN3199_c0_g1~~TRINITY_DN3199_c0_g1_i1.p1  ORF type:complete len:374 (-),score=114.00 TRINITY_DN3199_c0_g1_i1:23-1144(-)